MGLCLSYSLTLTASQVFLTRFYSSVEQYIISVERIKQYIHIPPEPPAVIQECRPSPSWPSQGNIELQNLMVMINSIKKKKKNFFLCFSHMLIINLELACPPSIWSNTVNFSSIIGLSTVPNIFNLSISMIYKLISKLCCA